MMTIMMIARDLANTAPCVSHVLDVGPIFGKGQNMIQRLLRPSGRNLCFAARAVALLVGFGICCGGGDVFAQFTAVNSITSLPDGATAAAIASTAMGKSATASGDSSVAVGMFSTASGDHSIAIGTTSSATAADSVAIGDGSVASGTSSTAVGHFSTAGGGISTALGDGSVASGVESIALGQGSTASGVQSIALGQGSTAAFGGSTAIGQGVSTTRANQMMLGTSANTYTAPGITSSTSRAAQSGSLQIMTTDSTGNLASDTMANLDIASATTVQTNTNNISTNTSNISTNTGNIAQNTQDIQGLQLATEDLRQDIRQNTEGVAMAMALSGVPTILPKCTNYAISTNWGTFGGENAMAVGGSARLMDNVFLNGGGAFGTSGRGNSGGGRAGVTFVW